MNTVKMKPATLRHGAVSCRRLATDAAAVARQIKAKHPPAELPPDAMSAVHDAMNQLQRSAIATERQALFLHQTVLLGLAADAPSSFGPHIKVPKLLSPWPHAGGGGHGVLGAIGHALKGAASQAVGMVTSTVDAVATLSALALYSADPRLAKLIPGATKKAKQFEAGVTWAIHHPEETLARLGEDTISYKLWKEGHYAEAIGHNVVAFASIFLLASKLGEAGEAVTVASDAERTMAAVAKTERATANALLKRQGSTIYDTATMSLKGETAALERQQIRANVAEGQHAAARIAREQAEAAHAQIKASIDHRPGVKDYVGIGQAGSAVMQDDQKAHKP
jgi:hypothetical protein